MTTPEPPPDKADIHPASTGAPPPFDPDTAPPWKPLHDPWFADPDQAQTWDGVSEFAESGGGA